MTRSHSLCALKSTSLRTIEGCASAANRIHLIGLSIGTVLFLNSFCLADSAPQGGDPSSKESAPHVLVLVETALQAAIQESLDRHRGDLQNEGFSVDQILIDASSSPHDVRSMLQDQYKSGIHGVLLVGDIPALKFNTLTQEGNPYWHDRLCDSYYADLDGVWTDTNSNSVFDAREGDIDAEIWVSRIKPNNPALGRDRADLIREYFDRNHAYRTGSLPRPPPRAFVVWTTIDILQSTTFGCRPDVLYGENVDVVGGCQVEGAADAFRRFLTDEQGYELGILNCMTFATIHHIDSHAPQKEGRQGKVWHEALNAWGSVDHGSADVTSQWVAENRPKTLFYHMLTSEPGRHDVPDYLCGAYLFGSSALVMIAGTQHSGAVGTPNIYPDLKAGRTFGEAWRDGLNYGIEHAGEPFARYFCWEKDIGEGTWTGADSMHTRAVLHGDGTLRLRPPELETAGEN